MELTIGDVSGRVNAKISHWKSSTPDNAFDERNKLIKFSSYKCRSIHAIIDHSEVECEGVAYWGLEFKTPSQSRDAPRKAPSYSTSELVKTYGSRPMIEHCSRLVCLQ